MPAFVFSGLIPTDYPFAKDAQGQNLGRVEPGDEREFDEAPDQWWVPADGAQDHSGTGTEMRAVEHPADGTWSPVAVGEDGTWTQAAVTVLPAEPEPPEAGEPEDPQTGPGD